MQFVAQMARVPLCESGGCGFDARRAAQFQLINHGEIQSALK